MLGHPDVFVSTRAYYFLRTPRSRSTASRSGTSCIIRVSYKYLHREAGMGDVIEPCADGGFDIPTTPVAIPVSRLTSQSSNVVSEICGEMCSILCSISRS